MFLFVLTGVLPVFGFDTHVIKAFKEQGKMA
jgi:hypothetical protein